MTNIKDLPIVKEIVCELTSELRDETGFNAKVLENKVKDAYRKVKSKRCYQYSRYTDEQIEQDLYDNYYSYVKSFALYYYNMMGAEHQVSHSENGVSRTWRSENDILSGVISFVKVL